MRQTAAESHTQPHFWGPLLERKPFEGLFLLFGCPVVWFLESSRTGKHLIIYHYLGVTRSMFSD